MFSAGLYVAMNCDSLSFLNVSSLWHWKTGMIENVPLLHWFKCLLTCRRAVWWFVICCRCNVVLCLMNLLFPLYNSFYSWSILIFNFILFTRVTWTVQLSIYTYLYIYNTKQLWINIKQNKTTETNDNSKNKNKQKLSDNMTKIRMK